jgi:hypothetical protein
MGIRLLRNALAALVPNWMANLPGANTAYKTLYTTALLGDSLLETSWEGLLAAFPGVGTDTALPLHAQSRGLLQGPNEPNSAFAKRLTQWLVTWAEAGSAEILAQQIQAYLVGQGTLGAGVLPIVRVVDRSGNWTIANADGSITNVSAPFNWDASLGWDDGATAQAGGEVTGWWSDMWIVVAPPTGTSPIYLAYTGTSDPVWLSNFGPNATLGGGHRVPLSVAVGIESIIASWKGAHTWFRAVIWPSDATSYAPAAPTADGTFGNFSKAVAGVQVPGRTASERFWIPVGGG